MEYEEISKSSSLVSACITIFKHGFTIRFPAAALQQGYTTLYAILHTILRHSLLYHTMLYYTISYYSIHTILHHTTRCSILHCAIPYYTILYYTILCYIYYTILYYAILNYTLLYYTPLCDAILYCTTPVICYNVLLYLSDFNVRTQVVHVHHEICTMKRRINTQELRGMGDRGRRHADE